MTTVFDLDDPLRPELRSAFERCWAEIAAPGTWWDGAERVAIADVARQARSGCAAASDVLAAAAVAAASLVAAEPSTTTERWVGEMCDALGECRYVELIGIVARVVAVDTFHRLTGHRLAPLPEPQPGAPGRQPSPDGLRKNHAWVAMAMPVPPFVLGSVPAAMAAMNDLSNVLYMPMDEMGDPDWRRGELHRTQVELVAATMSHANQCFY